MQNEQTIHIILGHVHMELQYSIINPWCLEIYHSKGAVLKRGVNVAPPLEYFFAVGGMF